MVKQCELQGVIFSFGKCKFCHAMNTSLKLNSSSCCFKTWEQLKKRIIINEHRMSIN